MHVETAYSQGLMPRLTQHRVRRHDIQLVMHPASDQCPDHTADEAAHCGRGGYRLLALRRLVVTPVCGYAARSCSSARSCSGARPGSGACTCTCASSCTAAGPRSWIRRIIGVVSIWHVYLTPVFFHKALLSYTQGAPRRKSRPCLPFTRPGVHALSHGRKPYRALSRVAH